MIVNKGFRFRMYPSKQQEYIINTAIGSCRFVYNNFLDVRIKSYQWLNQHSSYKIDSSELIKLKEEFPWLKRVPSDALQQTLKDLDKAYNDFFKLGRGFPKFKAKHKAKLSYRCVSSTLDILENHVKIPKLGLVEIKQSFNLPKNIKINNATISKSKSGKYFVSFSCEVEAKVKPRTDKEVGIDLGLKEFATLSDGLVIPRERFTKKYEVKLAREQRKLSKMVIGSNNRTKQKKKVARIHEKIANCRNDFLHKVTNMLVNNYDVICIEDLNTSGMMKNHKLAKAISDVSFHEFKRQLVYKCQWYGKILSIIDRWFPSSKTCSSCGTIKKQLSLSERTYKCEECNLEIDRDINASINILTVGTTGLA